MILRALTHAVCPNHGDCLHRSLPGRVECVACVPAVLAEPPPVRPPRERKRTPSRGGSRFGVLGRPRATDLTDAERRVAELLASGLTQSDVARTLGIERSGISSTVQRAMSRIGAARTHELLRYVRRQTRATPCE